MMSPLRIASLAWDPVVPPVFIVGPAVALAAFTAWTYLKTGPRLAPARRGVLLALRLSALALLVLLLFQPQHEESLPRHQPRRVVLAAVDVSQSMAETDAAGQTRRLDAARQAIAETGLLGAHDFGEVRFFAFDEDARPVAEEGLASLAPDGPTTRLHQSLTTVLASLRPGEKPEGIFLFSDGRDFENVSPARTGQAARQRRAPIYPLVLGRVQVVPDVAVHLASHQPYTFIGQKTRLQAAIRFTAAENQPVRVELVREGAVLRDRVVNPAGAAETMVSFEVSEAEPGQYEYEIRTTPIPDEREIANNTVFTFLNVTNARIRVLLLEGEPHWDTTFLQRTLSRNERIALDSVIAIGSETPRLTRTGPDPGPFVLPRSEAEFAVYPVVVAGRGLDTLLGDTGIQALSQAVSEGGTTLVLARGAPGPHPAWQEMAPAAWQTGATGPVKITSSGGGGEFLPWDVLRGAPGGPDTLPTLPFVRSLQPPKSLAAVEAMAEDTEQKSTSPAFLHRRHGAGQVLAVAVEGLWKWSLHAKGEPTNNLYDRFWNQLLLNLIARSNALPTDRAQLTVDSANVLLGEKVRLRVVPAAGHKLKSGTTISLWQDARRLADVPLESSADGTIQNAEWLATATGRYRAETSVDGQALTCRFAVSEERRETTDVSPDATYLRRLAEASGGRLLDPATLADTLTALRKTAAAEADTPPQIRRTPLWDRPVFYFTLCALLGLEWYLRRRWGLT